MRVCIGLSIYLNISLVENTSSKYVLMLNDTKILFTSSKWTSMMTISVFGFFASIQVLFQVYVVYMRKIKQHEPKSLLNKRSLKIPDH